MTEIHAVTSDHWHSLFKSEVYRLFFECNSFLEFYFVSTRKRRFTTLLFLQRTFFLTNQLLSGVCLNNKEVLKSRKILIKLVQIRTNIDCLQLQKMMNKTFSLSVCLWDHLKFPTMVVI